MYLYRYMLPCPRCKMQYKEMRGNAIYSAWLKPEKQIISLIDCSPQNGKFYCANCGGIWTTKDIMGK